MIKLFSFRNWFIKRDIKRLELKLEAVGGIRWYDDGDPNLGYCGYYQRARAKRLWKKIKQLKRDLK